MQPEYCQKTGTEKANNIRESFVKAFYGLLDRFTEFSFDYIEGNASVISGGDKICLILSELS